MRKKQFAMVIISVIPIIILILAIIGYNSTNKLAFSKENIKYTQKKVKIFMKEHNDKNGIYLYDDGKNVDYLFINGFIVNNGDKATYFTDIKMEVKEGTLIINFNEKYTDDYNDKEIENNNRVLYKIKKPKNVDTIKIYKNGQETHFDCVGVF